MTGIDSGRTTLIKILTGEAPSIIAASIKSFGIFIKKFRIIKKYQPLTKVGTNKAKIVFRKFKKSTSRNCGIKPPLKTIVKKTKKVSGIL